MALLTKLYSLMTLSQPSSPIPKDQQNSKKCKTTNLEDALNKIRADLFSGRPHDIRNGVLNLIYVYLRDTDISWAIVPMINLSAGPLLQNKMIGYLGISLAIQHNKKLRTLVINTINKDLNSIDLNIKITAMDTLSYLIDENFASTIMTQIFAFMSSPHASVRKRVPVLLFLCFKYSPSLIEAYLPSLFECLYDNDPTIQCVAATVLVQIQENYPINFTNTLDQLLRIMLDSSNNRLLNKTLKILTVLKLSSGHLAALEQKVLTVFQGSAAFSLIFECIRFSFKKLQKSSKIIDASVNKVKEYINHADPNLQYMSLNVLKDLVHVRRDIVMALRNDIAGLLLSEDSSICLEAIDLMLLLVNKSNIKSLFKLITELVERSLSKKSSSENYTDNIIIKLIQMCRSDDYSLLTNFEWYVNNLIKLIMITFEYPSKNVSDALSSELLSVALRVAAIREYLVEKLELIVLKIKESPLLRTSTYSFLIQTIIWICSEYIEYVKNPSEYMVSLQKPWLIAMNCETQFNVLHSMLKTISYIMVNSSDREKCLDECTKVIDYLNRFESSDLQTQERAICYKILLETISEQYSHGDDLIIEHFRELFKPELKEISQNVQKKVEMTFEFDMDTWINKDFEKLINSTNEEIVDNANIEISEPLKLSVGTKKLGYIDMIQEDSHYTENQYEIAAVVHVDIETTKEVKPKLVFNNDSLKQTVKKKNHISATSKASKTRSDTFLNLKIATFLSNQISRHFESSFHESRFIKGVTLSEVIDKLKGAYIIKIIDQNESAVLINIMTSVVLFILIKIENSCLHINTKSHSPKIPDEVVNSLRSLLFEE